MAGIAANTPQRKGASSTSTPASGSGEGAGAEAGGLEEKAGREGVFITGRSVRSGIYLMPEAQAQPFCCPSPSGNANGTRGSLPPLPVASSSSSSGGGGATKGPALGPKAGDGALDMAFLPVKEIASSSVPVADQEGMEAAAAAVAAAAAGAKEDGQALWLTETDPAVDAAAEWLLNQCFFAQCSISSGGGGCHHGHRRGGDGSAAAAGSCDCASAPLVMALSSAALLDVPRLRAAVELLVERQAWFVPADSLTPHLGPFPPSEGAADPASSNSKAACSPITALTLPAFLARWTLACVRHHWQVATACPSLVGPVGSQALRLPPVREEQRGDTLAFLSVATLASSAASSCCSASCCSSAPTSSASYYGFGAEVMTEMWHGMRREERLALLARLEKDMGEEIRPHLVKADGGKSGGKGASKTSSSSSTTTSGSEVDSPKLPSPRRILLHALGQVRRPHADAVEGGAGGPEGAGAGGERPSAATEEAEVAALAEDESVGEVLLEALCLFRLPHFYAVMSAWPVLTPQLATALRRSLESFYADELARRLILEEEEEQEEGQEMGAGGRKGGSSSSVKAKRLRKKEKLRSWLLKQQQQRQAAEARGQSSPAPEQPIPCRPPATMTPAAAAEEEDEAATPAEGGRCDKEGQEPSAATAAAAAAAAAALHTRSHSAEDSINAEAPDLTSTAVGAAATGAEAAGDEALSSAAAVAAKQEGENEKVVVVQEEDGPEAACSISRSTSMGSASGVEGDCEASAGSGCGACSPTTVGDEEEEEEDGGRSSYTTSPSGSSSTSSNGPAHRSSAVSISSPSPIAASGPNAHQGDEDAKPSSAGRAMGALSPPPPLVIDPAGAGAVAVAASGPVLEEEQRHEEADEAESEAEMQEDVDAGVGMSLERQMQMCGRLSQELGEMALGLREVAARRRPWQYCALTQLEQAVGLLWPKASCEVYGSFTTGLSIPASDLDVVITHLPLRQGHNSGAHLLSELSDFLGAQEWVASVRCVRHAAMPIIKLTTAAMPLYPTMADGARAGEAGAGVEGGAPPAPHGVIKIDISLDLPGLSEGAAAGAGEAAGGGVGARARGQDDGGEAQGPEALQAPQPPVHYGLQSSMFVQRLCMVHPQLPPLVLVLKQLLLQRGLSDSYTGGLSSYALTIMVAAILQPYVLEPPEHQPSLGALFLTFLQTYGTATFDTGRFGVCLAPPPYGPLFAIDNTHGGGGGMPGHQDGSPPRGGQPWQQVGGGAPWRPTDPVVIQDPLRAANNVGRSCFGFRQVQVVFDQCLSRVLSFGERMLAAEEEREQRRREQRRQQKQQARLRRGKGGKSQAIGSTEREAGGNGSGSGSSSEEGEGEGEAVAESILGIALFGASHHRCVIVTI